MQVNIIGTGNVAWHLAKRFETLPSVRLKQVCGRSPVALTPFVDLARKTASIEDLKPADVTIIAVSDDVIASVSEQIPFSNQLVVHTSGSIPMEMLSIKNRKGVFYPAQSFSMEDKVDFKNVPLCLEFEDKADKKLLSELALNLSENIHILNSAQRQQLHIAAVFANNFTNYCYTMAKEICDEHRIPFSLLHPLMEKTVAKAMAHSPQLMQTGPARRGDHNVIEQHIAKLTSQNQVDLYKAISTSLLKHYGKEL
ncbi:DUF2520 domain-containing protein [Dokdonia sinensis]|uniref:DUF2520 domain-containing protein n=1 Tax=Dokdonia sinensis TaxID=2479847 RepID=A0A3M0G8Z0_9FLAO|nr:DUF2520 domain-containing protein [Dokdonia sinensis]